MVHAAGVAININWIEMSNVILATKTIAAINEALERDQGASFRMWLGRVLPHIGDAYRADEDGFRSHLGGSLLGRPCARELWYGFRWVKKAKFPASVLRLFNRGHLEEGRFIALLLIIGCEVYQQDAQGKQIRISASGGHVGGSLDGEVLNIPDVPAGVRCLTEFKTHNDKSFQKLVKEGVRSAKFEHFVQMQVYMRKRGLNVALYLAVNKNNDALHGELVYADPVIADQFLDRGDQIVFLPTPPPKINNNPGWFECSFCDYKQICHGNEQVERNCRTCRFSNPDIHGDWMCKEEVDLPIVIEKEFQQTGCSKWQKHESL